MKMNRLTMEIAREDAKNKPPLHGDKIKEVLDTQLEVNRLQMNRLQEIFRNLPLPTHLQPPTPKPSAPETDTQHSTQNLINAISKV